jgi:endonuclease/exonuclease/phosphatase family metal-dependent hydrolase
MNRIREGSFVKQIGAQHVAKLLDWNIERGTDFEKIEAALRKHDPDLCILQEVDLHARRSGGKDVARPRLGSLSGGSAIAHRLTAPKVRNPM